MRLEESYPLAVSLAKGAGRGSGTALKALALLGVAVLAAAMVYAWHSELDLRSLSGFGYPGVFLLAFLSAATVLVPVPGLLATAAGGALWNPAVVGLAAGLGAATGELIGYAAGRAGRVSIKGRLGRRWQAAEKYLGRFGFWAILALAIIPNPVFDALGLTAGVLAYPAGRFWIAAAIGNCLKYTAFAHLGGMLTWPIG